MGGLVVIGVISLIAIAPYRLHRLLQSSIPLRQLSTNLLGGKPAHSVMGLASGGIFGVGLGASRQKWGNLSEAHTDFIFSVIGGRTWTPWYVNCSSSLCSAYLWNFPYCDTDQGSLPTICLCRNWCLDHDAGHYQCGFGYRCSSSCWCELFPLLVTEVHR